MLYELDWNNKATCKAFLLWYYSPEVMARKQEILRSIERWNKFYDEVLKYLPPHEREKMINGGYYEKACNCSQGNSET